MELLLKHGASIQAVTEVREKVHLQSLLYAVWSLLINNSTISNHL